IYGISQYADGGLISPKPYFSGSDYIIKMSNYSRGEWSDIWDALYMRFVAINRDSLAQNPRMKLLVHHNDITEKSKLQEHIKRAEDYLRTL
ncbi:MAG: cryptochrome/photolyase family protein, partial [Candidatus Kapabacteria bacterium]|nr:cryptochrome/photolyase family protein [Candidatus Kapabacteria bacterium]